MTDVTPNPKTLDLGAVLAGVAYPKDVVSVYLREDVAYELNKVNEAINRAQLLGEKETLEALEKERDKLIEIGQASRLEFHLTGVSRKVRQAVVDKVDAEFPPEFNLLGQRMPNSKADDMHANHMWSVHVEKIVAPDGSESIAPSPENIAQFREAAPDLAIRAVEAGIKQFTDGAKSGFESLAQEHAFLSQPSPEA